MQINFPNYRCFLLNDPKHAEHVLHDHSKNYVKQTRGYAALRTVLGNGLLTSEGSFWLRQRRLAQPAFHRERMAGWGDVMVRDTNELVDSWATRITQRTPFDVHEDMMRLALRIVGEALLSVDVTGAVGAVGESLDALLPLIMQRTSRIVPWPEWAPIPSHVKFKRALKQLDDVVYGIIADRRRFVGHRTGVSRWLRKRKLRLRRCQAAARRTGTRR